ncbi:MAG: 5-formyltetrahydrofolate cyclo-ligase [Nitrospirae bacterium]|nr:5-formyltetrahydrofolate cyclo-ligase [Nitrospirota bacterium]
MHDKASLRRELLGKRDGIPPALRSEKSLAIRKNLESLDEFKRAGVIFIFASFRSEVDTFTIISDALSSGKRVVLPKVSKGDKTLELYEISGTDELVPGYMGIPEPFGIITGRDKTGSMSDRRRTIKQLDIVIIPGAGFDAEGNRIGYGGGYYDRLLGGGQASVPIVAPAFEAQIAGSVPTEPHDIKVNIIVTEQRIIRCG